jgi:cytochrome c-type biogenesis protein CcmH
MRAVIRTRIEAGEPDQQILDGFVASYGDGILTEPPKRGVGLGVWVGAAIGLALGLAILAVVLVGWRRTPAPVKGEARIDAEVAEEFGRFRKEFGR